ncbi:MAG: glycosyltransferase family 39 protein, partial [Anaerolineae bacterium]|nr:glycosyltransferase family 39 protein [Anaerolineae bacterium]
MKKRDWGTAALLCIGLGFALLGQYYFVYRRDPFFRDGIVFYSLAAAAFGVLWWRLRRPEKEVPPEPAAPKVWAERIPLRRVAAVGGLILAAFAGWTAARRPWDSDFSGVFWLWVVGVGWFLASFAPSIPKDWPQRCVGWLKRNRGEVWRVAALLAVALAVRGVALEEVPRNFGGDEGIQALAGLRLVERPLDNPFGTGWYSVPTMSFLLVGTAMRIFGATVAGARTLSAFAGMGAVLSTYLLARELWGRRVGTFAALLLAFGHYHLHFSRLASNQIGDALFITLALWLLVRGLASEEPWYFVLAGAVTGAAWYAYFGARLVLIVIGCYLGLRALKERGFLHRHWESLALMGLAAFVVVLPLLFHYLRDWGAMAARYNQVSIFSSGWLAQEQIVTGRSAVYLLLQQLWKAVSAFHYTVDPTFWYRPDIPLLDFVSGVFMLFGLVDVVRCRRWRSDGLLLLWFGLALVLGWTLNENPPSSQRLTITAP